MKPTLPNHASQIGLIIKTEPEMTGIFRWTYELQQALANIMPLDVCEVSDRSAGIRGIIANKLVYPTASLVGRDLRTARKNYPKNFENPKHLQPKIWHLASQTFAGILPRLSGPRIVTVFDLYPYIFNMYASSKDRRLYLKALSQLYLADHILTLSEAAKHEIVEVLNISPNRVSAVYPGIDEKFHMRNTENTDPYTIVYVGSELPRKNLTRLFEALALVFQKEPRARFIKVGRSQWPGSREMLKNLATKLGIEKRIEFHDYVEDLPAFYSRVGLSVQVSTHEGFGYPVLEAMACGVPVVASHIPILTEVSGGCAELVDPLDPSSMAQGMLTVLHDEMRRKKLIQDGLQWRQKFTFDIWGLRMKKFYERFL